MINVCTCQGRYEDIDSAGGVMADTAGYHQQNERTPF